MRAEKECSREYKSLGRYRRIAGNEGHGDKRARVIKDDAELEASQKLADAARLMVGNPAALELRRMQMVAEVGENNSTTVIVMPADFVHFAGSLSKFLEGKGGGLSAISFRDRRTQRLHPSGRRPTVSEPRFQTKAFASASQAFHSAVSTSRWCRLLPATRAQPVHIVPAWSGLFQS